VPAIQEGAFSSDDDAGPVLVTVEYDVAAERVSEFVEAMHRFGRIRRRDGASRWGIFRDLETPGRFVETFIVASWAEHLRQHDRATQADRVLEERLLSYTRNKVNVHHLISVR
jgi:Transmembrane secretion effector